MHAFFQDPDQDIGRHDLLCKAERDTLLQSWSGIGASKLDPLPLEVAFEGRVSRRGNHPALIFADQTWSYAYLNERADALAAALQRHGVTREVFVGVCTQRGPEMIMAQLAVFKAGGIYLPLDPNLPRARLAVMLADTRAPVLISLTGLMDETGDFRGCVLYADEQYPAARPKPSDWEREGAYVIYTSGTSGRPKGVVVSKSALSHHSYVAAADYNLGPKDRVLQFASLNFDAAMEQIWPALISGATLYPRADQVWEAQEFKRFVADNRLTVANLPTSYWAQTTSEWLGEDNLEVPTCLRLMIVGGEAMSPAQVRRWQQNTKTPLINAYGPTETTITATRELLENPQTDQPLSIGKPLAGRSAYVLDKALRPAPPCQPGMLFLGGVCLARGYLNQPALTAWHFVPDPFGDQPGSRLYRTGDRVRHLPDGKLQYLDRLDNQLKLRGFRIEPGEIEEILLLKRELSAAVVLARPEGFLTAYLVAANQDLTLDNDVLRAHLRNYLPEYMVPTNFQWLAQIPLTVNGKLDKKALPEPVSPTPLTGSVPPQSPLQEELVLLWQELLNLERVGIGENFFDLGGHSLLVTKFLSRVRRRYQVEPELRVFFEGPTIAQFGEYIAALQQWATQGEAPSAGPDECEEDFVF